MIWTHKHSRNAVAAKQRRRIERALAEPDVEIPQNVFKPRKAKPDFIVRVEDRFGERVQVSITRFMGHVRTSEGQSARQFCRGLEQLITKSA
mgnify:FL=1